MSYVVATCIRPTTTLTKGETYLVKPLRKEGLIRREVHWDKATHGLVQNDYKNVRYVKIDRFKYERQKADTGSDG